MRSLSACNRLHAVMVVADMRAELPVGLTVVRVADPSCHRVNLPDAATLRLRICWLQHNCWGSEMQLL